MAKLGVSIVEKIKLWLSEEGSNPDNSRSKSDSAATAPQIFFAKHRGKPLTPDTVPDFVIPPTIEDAKRRKKQLFIDRMTSRQPKKFHFTSTEEWQHTSDKSSKMEDRKEPVSEMWMMIDKFNQDASNRNESNLLSPVDPFQAKNVDSRFLLNESSFPRLELDRDFHHSLPALADHKINIPRSPSSTSSISEESFKPRASRSRPTCILTRADIGGRSRRSRAVVSLYNLDKIKSQPSLTGAMCDGIQPSTEERKRNRKATLMTQKPAACVTMEDVLPDAQRTKLINIYSNSVLEQQSSKCFNVFA